MKTALIILSIWFIVSIPIGIVLGKLLHEIHKHYPPTEGGLE